MCRWKERACKSMWPTPAHSDSHPRALSLSLHQSTIQLDSANTTCYTSQIDKFSTGSQSNRSFSTVPLLTPRPQPAPFSPPNPRSHDASLFACTSSPSYSVKPQSIDGFSARR
ncbi:hypothetical protein BCR44DRAFT_1323524 [Catenaria anguillulae PL171]|uniref:Uncharacterized protein n=1 Tax=Catenaria anguillulae PL171 TaxID=765915 RepID=A0A1Y2HUW0_9FUNG|nr:hypothetical protein BCR44DRAFT_1323524 [Catenaria anguillulae PL171]